MQGFKDSLKNKPYTMDVFNGICNLLSQVLLITFNLEYQTVFTISQNSDTMRIIRLAIKASE